MSSPNRLSHRRRSHSASSPNPHKQLDDVKWRISVKRSRPSSIRTPSYKDLAHDEPAEKWDVEQWRRGKRARRGSQAKDSICGAPGPSHNVVPVDPAFSTEQPLAPGRTAIPRLPCSSAAFQFSSQKEPPRKTQARRARLSRGKSPREGDRISSDEARRMHADALGELQRSVEESGESLVRRMRDWERAGRPSRLAPDSPHRARHSTTPYYGSPQASAAVEEQSDDDDDILIVDKPASPAASRSPAYKKRALSLSMMDVDLPEDPSFVSPGACDCSSSPVRCSGPSDYSSDDEGHADMDTDLASSGIFSTPALSHTYSVSTNSSMVSLSLSLQSGDGTSVAAPPPGEISLPSAPSTASRSEKAIAALTLAMANGAAGISDYEALRLSEDGLTTLDAAHAGELWN